MPYSSVTLGRGSPGEIPADSVEDPDPLVRGPDPAPDPFYHQPKIVRKTLIPTVLWLLYDFLSLKRDVNLASKSKKQKNEEEKNNFSCHLEDH